MAQAKRSVISSLNHIIVSNIDREKGYTTAAEAVDDKRLRTAFLNYARESQSYIIELRNILKSFNNKTEESGSISGSLFRGWINIKSVVTGKEAKPILDECERGEDSAVLSYRAALRSSNLPGKIREILVRQYSNIKAAHDTIRNFRDNWKESE